ncbi:hypothetical protein JTB14_015120, partial [Gonioctena quinquepunctata]
LKPKFLFQAN